MANASANDIKQYQLIQVDRNSIPNTVQLIRFCQECELTFAQASRKQRFFALGISMCVSVFLIIIYFIGGNQQIVPDSSDYYAYETPDDKGELINMQKPEWMYN